MRLGYSKKIFNDRTDIATLGCCYAYTSMKELEKSATYYRTTLYCNSEKFSVQSTSVA